MTRKAKACQFFEDDGGSVGLIARDGDGFDLYIIDRTEKVRRFPIGRAVALHLAWWLVRWLLFSDWMGLRSLLDRLTLSRQLKRASQDDGKSRPTARVAWPGHNLR